MRIGEALVAEGLQTREQLSLALREHLIHESISVSIELERAQTPVDAQSIFALAGEDSYYRGGASHRLRSPLVLRKAGHGRPS